MEKRPQGNRRFREKEAVSRKQIRRAFFYDCKISRIFWTLKMKKREDFEKNFQKAGKTAVFYIKNAMGKRYFQCIFLFPGQINSTQERNSPVKKEVGKDDY